jgi:hypothetical protein
MVQTVHVHAPKGTSGLGIAALVLGIGACLICWIPFVGIVAIPLAVIGGLLAVIGLFGAVASRKTSMGMPISGGIVCLVAIGIAAAVTVGSVKAVDSAVKAADQELSKSAPPPVKRAASVSPRKSTIPATESPPVSAEPSAPAPAKSSVITYDQYSRIENGMSYREVCEILGRGGEEISSNQIQGVKGVMPSVSTVCYSWKNPMGPNMMCIFQNDKLTSKSQFGLR